ncbi:MAG TPA: SDR family NAD(P)-dependent oxidoreductase [Bryobacteraceae bacterium]
MSKEFEGMKVLVTGSSNGIGAEAAVQFAERGAGEVLVQYHSAKDEAEQVCERIRRAGAKAEMFGADLSSRAGIQAFLAELGERHIDILVNNAGSLIKRTPFLEFTEELWDQVITLNFHSAFSITRHILPQMVERGRGFVVNISSVAARNGGGVGSIAYSSSKGGLSTMTKGLAREFAPLGIRVNGVSPGTIDTNFHRQFSNAEMLNRVKGATPAGRLGDSAETAEVILFLCGDGARFIHGQMIEVNGGFLMV